MRVPAGGEGGERGDGERQKDRMPVIFCYKTHRKRTRNIELIYDPLRRRNSLSNGIVFGTDFHSQSIAEAFSPKSFAAI